jgi:hypothetical protein
LLKRIKAKYPWKHHTDAFIWTTMPGQKTDINNMGGFSMDMIGENWDYPDASYEEREHIIKKHEDYTKGLLYFVGNDPSVPGNIREQMRKWGYPKDEYVNNNHWSPQLYVREARRMIGEVVMTQHHCQGREIAQEPVAWAAYTMDSHNCDRYVVNGMVKNEGNVEIGGFGPYPVAYRSITPKREEAGNLLVPVCLSASHIAYGSIRMEPVFMVLAQSAAIAACISIDEGTTVQEIDGTKILAELRSNPLADGSQPEIIIDNDTRAQVEITGDWKKQQWKAYGTDFLVVDKTADKLSVKYTPEIKKTAGYDIYTYFPKVDKATTRTTITVYDGKTEHPVVIESDDVIIAGQTSGEWVHLGKYTLSEGNNAYICISNKDADGIVVADAVLLMPIK